MKLKKHNSSVCSPAFSNTGCYGGVALDLDYLNLRVGKRTHAEPVDPAIRTTH
jgi:hypothetical protein